MVATAAGQPWHGRRGEFGFGGGDGWPPLPMLAAALDLTQAQQDQAKAIMSSHRAEFQQLRERGRTAHEAVRKAVETEPVNEQAIRTAVGQASQLEADGAVLRARVRQEMLALLSADQRAKLDQMKKSFADRARERRNNRGTQRPQSTQPQEAQPSQPQQ
jgi:Spy/CpxP family protein refolding chaperone